MAVIKTTNESNCYMVVILFQDLPDSFHAFSTARKAENFIISYVNNIVKSDNAYSEYYEAIEALSNFTDNYTICYGNSKVE